MGHPAGESAAKLNQTEVCASPHVEVFPVTELDDEFYICLRACNARLALDFYQRAFSASRVCCFSDSKGRIVHARLAFGRHRVAVTDEFPEWGAFAPVGERRLPFAIHLRMADVDEATSAAVAAGAVLTHEPQNQPYGDRRAILRDPMGYEWVLRRREGGELRPGNLEDNRRLQNNGV
jgi:PhnB protein